MGPIDFRRLREQIDARKVCELLQIPLRSRGPCPIHKSKSSTSKVFSLDIRGQGRFQCFKCGAKGNALDLYAEMTCKPLYTAAIDLCNDLGLAVPWLNEKSARFLSSGHHRRQA